jgi:glycosyltransferase involved in cell wall biosynthesis
MVVAHSELPELTSAVGLVLPASATAATYPLDFTKSHNSHGLCDDYLFREVQMQKNPDRNKPVITIITATYNAAHDLPWTIKSIREQIYPNIQWIVADGGSTDDTINLLRENEDIIDVWFSEPDGGIYDAWNKALRHLKGDWVQFIGAGDELADKSTLSLISSHLSSAYPSYDIVYGQLLAISKTTRETIVKVATPWDKLKGQWNSYLPARPCHPEVFHHSSLFKNLPVFDVSYKIAGDAKFITEQRLVKDFKYVPILVDKMVSGGVSSKIKSFIECQEEEKRIGLELGIKAPFFQTLPHRIRYLFKRTIYKHIPDKWVRIIFDFARVATGKKRTWTIE